MELPRLLQAVGLEKKPALVYSTCLEHGPLSISSIARISDLKRPTVHNIVQELVAADLLVLLRKNKRTVYDAERPRKLLTVLRAREAELERSLPALEALRNRHADEPRIEVLEGESAVRKAYDELYARMNRKTETCFLTSLDDLMRLAPFSIENYFAVVAQRKQLFVRELILDDEQGKRYQKQRKELGIKTEFRILPATFPIHNDIALQGDTTYFFSFQQRMFVTVIQSVEITRTMKGLFEWAWQHGKRG